jgi:hypothetical protein
MERQTRASGFALANPELNLAVKPCDVLHSCQHIYPKGRHCRQAVIDPDSAFCAAHAPRPRLATLAPNPASELASKLKEVESAADVTQFLAGLLNLLADNRVSARRAAVLTYIANSMLHSIRATQREDDSPGQVMVDWSGIPRPDHSLPQESPGMLPIHT